jgi:hypothetical protein
MWSEEVVETPGSNASSESCDDDGSFQMDVHYSNAPEGEMGVW